MTVLSSILNFSAIMVLGMSLAELAKIIIIVAAIVAILLIALRVFGIAIPEWAWQMFWVVVVAFVAIILINLLASM